jgi:heptosyltransferase-2
VTHILIIKTGALGDVLRTTSILAGLQEREAAAHIEWVTAPAAASLVAGNPRVARVHRIDPKDEPAVQALGQELAQQCWDWVISLDDEWPLCRLASLLGVNRLSGAIVGEDGERTYSSDVAPWFDMGLLSKHGKQAADRMKLANRRSHPEIYAQMLGVDMGRPELEIDADQRKAARASLGAVAGQPRTWIGLNTGAGGRWTSKQLPVERVIELAGLLQADALGELGFVVLGGRDEAQRNAEILAGLEGHAAGLTVVDAGTDNSLLAFAAIIDSLDLLVTSDSLALHMAVARKIPIVAFFAPTSAAEIELYGLGEKVQSLGADYCSYRADADNSSITPERLASAANSVLTSRGEEAP